MAATSFVDEVSARKSSHFGLPTCYTQPDLPPIPVTGHKLELELLHSEIEELDTSLFRLQVDGRAIKYLTIEPGLYSVETMSCGPSLVSVLPDFPPGDWNDGLIARDPNTGQPHFARTARTRFRSVQHVWHATYVEYADLVIGEYLETEVCEVTCPQFDTVVIAKFARFDWEIQYMENETIVYERINEHGIAPRFLGHLTEEGRVIGFLMERIADARHARPEDLAACQEVLSRFHQFGFHHGDVYPYNFLVRGSEVLLIDFETTQKCDNQASLRGELEGLTTQLDIRLDLWRTESN